MRTRSSTKRLQVQLATNCNEDENLITNKRLRKSENITLTVTDDQGNVIQGISENKIEDHVVKKKGNTKTVNKKSSKIQIDEEKYESKSVIDANQEQAIEKKVNVSTKKRTTKSNNKSAQQSGRISKQNNDQIKDLSKTQNNFQQHPILMELGELVEGVVIKRPSSQIRTPYVADVNIPKVGNILAHTPALDCAGMIVPNATVYMTETKPKNESEKNSRKTTHSIRIALEPREEGHPPALVGSHPQLAEQTAFQALKQKLIPELGNYQEIEREKKFRNTRVDFVLKYNKKNITTNDNDNDDDDDKNREKIDCYFQSNQSPKYSDNDEIHNNGDNGDDDDDGQKLTNLHDQNVEKINISKSNGNSQKISIKNNLNQNSNVKKSKQTPINSKYNNENEQITLLEVKNAVCADYPEGKVPGCRGKIGVYTSDTVPYQRTAIFPHGAKKPKIKVVSDRAIKQINDLIQIQNQGIQCSILFIVSRDDCVAFRPCHEADMLLAQILLKAKEVGVKVLAHSVIWGLDGVGRWGRPLPVNFHESVRSEDIDYEHLEKVLEFNADKKNSRRPPPKKITK